MPLGWIDFSKSDRSKVLSVLDQLSEAGTLDELGVAPIRDGFADLFFPGTSTIQTRAKYFLIVPYALKDFEHSIETNPNRALRAFDEVERQCAEHLLANKTDIEGVIGGRSLSQNKWVKRSPADIYWAGLRNYSIFNGGNLSLSEYVRAVCALKNQKSTLTQLGNRSDQAEENEKDDKDAGEVFHRQFWKIPTYRENWMDDLDIRLTPEEGAFLKKQIISAYPKSVLAYILNNNMTSVLQCKSFQDLGQFILLFPDKIQNDYELAIAFSSFLYVLRVLYNVIVSDGQNEEANNELEKLRPSMVSRSSVNLESIFDKLMVRRNVFLCSFLRKARTLMVQGDIEGLKTEIKRRERELKQNRAKTLHPGEFNPSDWFGGRELDYRFANTKVIISDIFESEGQYAESRQ